MLDAYHAGHTLLLLSFLLLHQGHPVALGAVRCHVSITWPTAGCTTATYTMTQARSKAPQAQADKAEALAHCSKKHSAQFLCVQGNASTTFMPSTACLAWHSTLSPNSVPADMSAAAAGMSSADRLACASSDSAGTVGLRCFADVARSRWSMGK